MKKVILSFIVLLMSLFVLGQTAPTVTTSPVNNIQQLRAQGGGNVISEGSSAVVKRGLVWSTSPNPKVSPIYKNWRRGVPRTGLGQFTNTFIAASPNFDNVSGIMPLLPNTTYYVRAFAMNATDTGYGQEVVFTTLAAGPSKNYYFSSTGNDANDGLAPSRPKKTLVELQRLVSNTNVTFAPGDSILFRRGDVFDNGYDGIGDPFAFVSCGYIDRPFDDLTAPSGTPEKPIVFSSYGDPALPLPNLIFPTATFRQKGGPRGWVLEFAGVSNIIVDGLQFNDTRFPLSDKSNPAYTYGGVLMGSYNNSKIIGTDTIWGTNRENGNRTASVFNFTLRNCVFNNMSFGIGSVSAFDSKITKNTFTNLKSTIDTFGVNDVLGGGIEALNGKRLEISYNYIRGAWAKSGRKSSTQGMGGIAMDVFNLQDSKIIYNTIIDCSGFLEAGSLDLLDTLSGMYNDTIAYNKIINSFHVLTLHPRCGDPFLALQYNLRFWNNICIENDFSRFTGPNFGNDIYGDGQSFKNFWFWGNEYLTTGYNQVSGRLTSGSNVVTDITPRYPGIKVGGWFYGPEKASPVYFPGGESEYGIIQSVSDNGSSYTITLDRNLVRGDGSLVGGCFIFPPLSEKGITWSQPNNPSSQGYYGTFDNNLSNTRVFVNGSSSDCAGFSTKTTPPTVINSTEVITLTSVSSICQNSVVSVSSGTGAFPANTRVLRVYSPTQILVSAAPTTPIQGGATLRFSNVCGSVPYGNQYDTLLDVRNNVIWGTTGLQMVYPDSRFISNNGVPRIHRSNNLFYINGGFSHTFPPNTGRSYSSVSSLGVGATLKPSEIIITGNSKVFLDQSNPNPELWDFHLVDTSWGINNGTVTPGINKDWGGIEYTGNATVGIYKFSPKPILKLVSTTSPTCKTATNGTIVVSCSGGIAPYQYKIGTKPYGVSSTFTNLAAGVYSITVKDAKGVIGTLSVNLRAVNVNCP